MASLTHRTARPRARVALTAPVALLAAVSVCVAQRVAAETTAGPAIDLSSASTAPLRTVAITATLSNGGGQIVATSNDIVYDSSQVNVALKQDGKPDCTISATIGADSSAAKSLVASQPRSPR